MSVCTTVCKVAEASKPLSDEEVITKCQGHIVLLNPDLTIFGSYTSFTQARNSMYETLTELGDSDLQWQDLKVQQSQEPEGLIFLYARKDLYFIVIAH